MNWKDIALVVFGCFALPALFVTLILYLHLLVEVGTQIYERLIQ